MKFKVAALLTVLAVLFSAATPPIQQFMQVSMTLSTQY